MDELLQMKELMIILVIISVLLVINFILLIITLKKTRKLNQRYVEFMSKLGKGEDIAEMLKKYMQDVMNVTEESHRLTKSYKELESNLEKCIQKVGMVKYNAFQHNGNELSFALALLDFEDNGVVINGVYSRDNTTNTYAKPIEHGASKYPLAKEEEEALDIAKQKGYRYFMDVKNKEMKK